jgi:hypothetical protein
MQALKFKPPLKQNLDMAAAVAKIHLRANAATCRQAQAQFTVIDLEQELIAQTLRLSRSV